MDPLPHQRHKASPAFDRAGFVVLAFIAMLLDCSSVSWSQRAFTVREVRVAGRSAVSGEQVITAFGTPSGTSADSVAIVRGLERVLNLYRGEGYLRARVDSVSVAFGPDSSWGIIIISIAEGLPAVLRSISWNGRSAMRDPAVAAATDFGPGSRFSAAALESDIAGLLRAYEAEGYALATATIGDVRFTPSAVAESVDVSVTVAEGTQVRIAEYSVQGNRTTKETVILREARSHLGEVFRPSVGEQIRRRLLRLRLFSDVAEPQVYLGDHDRAGLLLRVSEGPMNSFDGIVGYVPSGRSGEEGFVTGLVNVQFRNLFGTARALAVRWYRENRSSQEIEVRYREPWVAGEPVNAQLGFGLRQQDSTFVRQHVALDADVAMSDAFVAGLSFSQTNVYPTEGYGKTVMGEVRNLTVGANLRYDTRDDPVTPSSGAVYETAYALGAKRTAGVTAAQPEKKFTTQRVTLDVGSYQQTFGRQVVSIELHARDIRSPQPDPSDLERLGGASTLRGYREGQFAGTRLVWANLEYRFPFERRSYAYAFGDVGSITLPSAASLGWIASDQTKAGFGIGLRVDSQVGLIGVSLGFGQGDTFSTAKLHLRLINEF